MTTNESTASDIAILTADLTHVASGVRVELRDGRVIVERVASVDSLANAVELLVEQET